MKATKKSLIKCINELNNISYLFTVNPTKDFSRNRKLSFRKVLTSILCMSGGSLTNEVIDLFENDTNMPSVSAFVQQRSKILPEAFETLFHMFNTSQKTFPTHKGYRLLSVDGSDIHIPTNKADQDSYYPVTNEGKSYNLLHLNALYDLCNHTYVDAIVQKSRKINEHQAFTDFVDRFPSNVPTIFIADRGYESYNNMAHIQEKGLNFLIRIKDSKGMVSGFELPKEDEFDVTIHLFLTRKQTNFTKELFKQKNIYKFIPHGSKFDFLPPKLSKFKDVEPYELHFRIVRFKITDNTFETVVTNLSEKDFLPQELKKLYAMRWGIETSFRDLKYTVGLLSFHSKKMENIIQEIFASLIMYNYTEMITSHVIIQNANKKYAYQANFSVAVHMCKKYILGKISPPILEAIILRNTVPIRPNRIYPRKMTGKTVPSFCYRVA